MGGFRSPGSGPHCNVGLNSGVVNPVELVDVIGGSSAGPHIFDRIGIPPYTQWGLTHHPMGLQVISCHGTWKLGTGLPSAHFRCGKNNEG